MNWKAFKKLMTHDVEVYKISTDGFGDETETLVGSEKGFFEYGGRQMYSKEHGTVQGTAVLYLKVNSNYDPTDDAKWIFKDVKNGRYLRLEQWNVMDDPRTGKTNHYELDLI